MMQISSEFKKFVLGKQNSLLENILLCVAINLACAFTQFDRYYFYSGFLNAVASVMLLIIWLWCGFLSGKSKDWGFLVFTGAYWLVPYLYMLYYKLHPDTENYGSFIAMLNKFASLIFEMPLKTIADFTNCGIYIWVLSLVILTGTLYFVGINVADIYNGKKRSEYTEEVSSDEDEM